MTQQAWHRSGYHIDVGMLLTAAAAIAAAIAETALLSAATCRPLPCAAMPVRGGLDVVEGATRSRRDDASCAARHAPRGDCAERAARKLVLRVYLLLGLCSVPALEENCLIALGSVVMACEALATLSPLNSGDTD